MKKEEPKKEEPKKEEKKKEEPKKKKESSSSSSSSSDSEDDKKKKKKKESSSSSSASSDSEDDKKKKKKEEPKKEKKESAAASTVSETKSGTIVKEGFLEKKGVIRHNWLKRWFVLEKGEKYVTMKYYKTKLDAKTGKAKGDFVLVNATLYAHVEKKGTEMPNYFNIRVGTRDFLIRAENATEKADWVKTIKASIVKDEDGPNSPKTLKSKKSNSFLGVVKENKEAAK